MFLTYETVNVHDDVQFIEACQISTQLHNQVQYVYLACVDRDHSKLKQLESLLVLQV